MQELRPIAPSYIGAEKATQTNGLSVTCATSPRVNGSFYFSGRAVLVIRIMLRAFTVVHTLNIAARYFFFG